MKIGNLDGPPVHTLVQFHQAAQKDLKKLILLEPHPDAKKFDHEFQSPTFKKPISERIKIYMKQSELKE